MLIYTSHYIVKNNSKSLIWVDTDSDIRLIMKSTAQTVIWADTDIHRTMETTIQGVI